MKFEDIQRDIRNKIFHPVYFLTGEEPYFIDKISKLIESTVLSDEEKEFNQVVVYGRDVTSSQIISLAREYPVFGNYRVVIVREAQNLKKIESDELLLSYLQKPVPSTLLVFEYKYKKVDGRTSMVKQLKKAGVFLETKKLYDNQLPKWIEDRIRTMGFSISGQTCAVIAESLGNDLTKIENELKKLVINVEEKAMITPDIVEQNIGISKDYNIFEFQKALGERNVLKANQIVNYFAANPKDNSALFVIIMLFIFFRKLFLFHFLKDKTDRNVAAQLQISPFFVGEYRTAANNYSRVKLRQIIAMLRDYDRKAKGVDTAAIDGGELMKEMVFKIIH
jgi:DNA polymerase III subunit delta